MNAWSAGGKPVIVATGLHGDKAMFSSSENLREVKMERRVRSARLRLVVTMLITSVVIAVGATASADGTRYLRCARGVGLVRMRYGHSNGMVAEAVLLSHKIAGKSDAYLPLQVGNQWTYAWQVEAGVQLIRP
jgi:hypothetical protein